MDQAVTFYSKFISTGSLVFDIGANVGNKTAVFRELGARVVAVEPQPGLSETLRHRFPDVIVVPKAAGRTPGIAKLSFGVELNLSSLSPDWITSVSNANRFPGHKWSNTVKVEVTTLDLLTREYGIPDFVKIDVEGYESEVLSGVSRPLKALSFEFTPEHISDTAKCVSILESLGPIEFNYSLEESLRMGIGHWVSGAGLLQSLAKFAGDNVLYGDVYARFL